MAVLKFSAMLMSLAVAALGVVGVIAPELLLQFVRSLLAPPALYAVAVVRVAFGAMLISVARVSRAPLALKVLGIVIVISGLLTPLFEAERFVGVVEWLSERLTLIRGVALVPLLLGLLLVYAINTNRRVE